MGTSTPGTATNPVSVVGLISASSGVGRTGAIVNVGWILASAGKTVLLIDWASEQPRIHDYLRPFYVARSAATDLPGYRPALLPGLEAPNPGEAADFGLHRYTVPVGVRRLHVLGPDPDGSPGPFTPPAGRALTLWWRGLRELRYDYVLIDWPTIDSPDAHARVSELCDVAGVLFLPRRSDIDTAAEMARELVTAVTSHARVIPVTTQFGSHDEDLARLSRERINAAFAKRVPDTGSLLDAVEIPAVPYEVYDEALAVMLDEPGADGTLLAAYERLTAAVTGDRIKALVPPQAAIKDRYRHRLGLPAPEHVWLIAIAYSVPNRPWAEWIRQRLTRAGARVLMVSPEHGWLADESVPSLVVVSSAGLPESPAVDQIARIIEASAAEAPVDVIGVRVPDGGAPREDWMPETAGANVIVVGKRPEAEVGGELLAHFGLFDQPGTQSLDPIRFPGHGAGPAQTNLSPRNESFLGREAELELLRDSVTGPRNTGRWMLAGLLGAGKSELAREYAHRFGYDYDLIWWIPSHDPIAARAALLRLAERVLRADTGDAVAAVLAGLRDGAFGRALLIYDNAEHRDRLAVLLPGGSASVDVLITTRDAAAWAGSEVAEVAGFGAEQSRDLLRGLVDGLSVSDGERIADRLGRLPLALRLAAGWLRESVGDRQERGATLARAAELAADDLLDRLDGTDPGATGLSPRLAGVIGVVLATMAETANGRLAVSVAELCAYLSPDGASTNLLRSEAMLERIRASAGERSALLLDTGDLDVALFTGTRYGLFEVNWGHPAAVVMHRSLQEFLRSAEPVARALTREDALAGLAAYAPKETAPDPADARARFEEVQRHLFSSGALYSSDDTVRRWLVNHLRYLYLNTEAETWRVAASIAGELSDRWRGEFAEADELRLRLDTQIANLHRALGEAERALEIDEAGLDIRRRTLGLRHRYTLISTRSRAADLRDLGRYEEAYAEDTEALAGFRVLLGDDHEQTRMAAHNLAISAYLFGDVRGALDLQRDCHQRLLRLLGSKHPMTLMSAAGVGIWLRELGDVDGAVDVLRGALDGIRQSLRPGHPEVLWIDWQHAVARRRADNPYWARNRNDETARTYSRLYGDDHPNTRGCRLSLAGDHHALGNAALAVELATDCLESFDRARGDHPCTSVCRMDLALYLRGAGDLPGALRQGERAHAALEEQLGPNHPWTLNAAVNHASMLAGRGHLSAAIELAEATDPVCRELLGNHHPYTAVSERNLARLRELATSASAGPDGGPWAEMDIDVLPI